MIGVLIIGIGILLFIVAIFKTKKNNEIIKNGILTKGVLVNYKEQIVDHDNARRATGVSLSVGNNVISNQHFYQTIYASVYEYVVNGINYYICDESYSSNKKALGSTEDIYYMSNNPENAVIKSKGSNVVLIIASIVFIIVGILILVIK